MCTFEPDWDDTAANEQGNSQDGRDDGDSSNAGTQSSSDND